MEQKFYICKHCKNMVYSIYDSGVKINCCGEEMKLLKAGEQEASIEKHIPVYEVVGNNVTVSVGSVIHPMQEVHYIEWILLATDKRVQLVKLNPNQEPKANFLISDDEVIDAVYAYCNLHGLWVKKND